MKFMFFSFIPVKVYVVYHEFMYSNMNYVRSIFPCIVKEVKFIKVYKPFAIYL